MYFLIIGCGRLGAELAFMLSDEGHDVVIIDRNNKAFNRLGSSFNGMTINGNGFDCEVLENAGIKQADVLAAVTDEDNINIIAAQIAKQIYHVPNVMARIYDAKKANTYKELGLEIISSTTVLARMFRDRFLENKIEKTIAPYQGRIELYTVEVKRPLTGKQAKDLYKPGLFILFMVNTKGQMILPPPDYTLMEGDKILGVGTVEGREKIHNMLWE